MRTLIVIICLTASSSAFAEVAAPQAIAACKSAIIERVNPTTTNFRKGSFEGRVMEVKFGLVDAAGKRSRAECRVSKRDGTVIELKIADR